ncbi:hypothetical protein PQR68_23350 [Paraburkholderia agricolaris]|uniref:hypothetical protein n=1 Tax=Paraburkholderia agricolaris TaxID=2152888 RepID=UPI0038BB023E
MAGAASRNAAEQSSAKTFEQRVVLLLELGHVLPQLRQIHRLPPYGRKVLNVREWQQTPVRLGLHKREQKASLPVPQGLRHFRHQSPTRCFEFAERDGRVGHPDEFGLEDDVDVLLVGKQNLMYGPVMAGDLHDKAAQKLGGQPMNSGGDDAATT